jgi:hypothetical protein
MFNSFLKPPFLIGIVSALVIALSVSPCERITKWETCPILKEDRSLVCV